MANRQLPTKAGALPVHGRPAPAAAQLAGYAGPVIVHNHYCTISGNGNIVNNGRNMTAGITGADSAGLLATIRAQAATISQMLNTIEAQAAQLARLKEELRRATSTE